jgi:pilus assembly protein FimV
VTQKIKKREEAEKIKKQPEIQVQPEIKKQPEIQVQPEIKKQPEIQVQPEIKNQPEIQIQPEIKNQPEIYEIFGKLNIDYKGQDPKKVQKMFAELVDEFNLLSFLDAEDIILKIIETKCDREKMNDWIKDSL